MTSNAAGTSPILRDAPPFIADLVANPELSQRFRDTLMAAELAALVARGLTAEHGAGGVP